MYINTIKAEIRKGLGREVTALIQKTKKPFLIKRKAQRIKSGDTRIRTRDTRIFSPMLYQLSYVTVVFQSGVQR